MISTLRDQLQSELGNLSQSLTHHTRSVPHQRFLDQQIIKFDHHNEAYTITDVSSKQIIWHFRIKERLGYDFPENPPMGEMDQYVLPWVRSWYQALILAGIAVFLENEITDIKFHFDINVPMKLGTGETKLVQVMTMPFDRDHTGQPVTFIQSFYVAKPYTSDAVGLEVHGPADQEGAGAILRSAILRKMASHSRITKGLTPQQSRIIKIIQELRRKYPDGTGLTDENIATELHGQPVDKMSKPARALNRNLSLFKSRLLKLIQDPKGKTEKASFLEIANPMIVITWFELSGIIEMLEVYKSLHGRHA
jgi:hypothetical protein